MVRMIVFLCLVLGLALPCFAQDQPAGKIKTLQGSVVVLRGEKSIPAALGLDVFPKDELRTGKDSSVGLTLEDDTLLSMGAESSLYLSEYVFDPKDNLFSLALRLIKGSFLYMSGVIGKLAPEKVHIETPDAIIGIRGTRFLVRVENGK